MSERRKMVFITGISRGLGKAIAEAFLARGDVVIGTVRGGQADLNVTAGELHVLPMDVTDRAQVFRTVHKAHSLHHRLDVIINNAGYGLLGSVEETSLDEANDVFAANCFGTLHVIQAALPSLRAQGSGHIVNISSIAGIATKAGYGLYAASKFAVEGLSESLADELRPLGIHVTLVEPGALRTDFLTEHSLRRTQKSIDEYAGTSGETARAFQQIAGKQIGDPALVAQAILRAIDSPKPPLHLLTGSDALRRARVKLEQLTREMNEWEAVTMSTDFAEAAKR